jgi:enoyl-CoA hydratase
MTATAQKAANASYQTILTEQKGPVGIITLNRPEALNALSEQLMTEVGQAIAGFEHNEDVGAIIITGQGEKAFAAGADIKEMATKSYMDVYKGNFITANWEDVSRCRKPVIAAVNGFALGGGCELAMMCDIIIAADTAKFSQPEITLGIIPGAGGTQRLTKAIGKYKAMDLVLTGRMIDAAEADRIGLVSKVVPAADLMTEALKIAEKICAQSLPIVMMAKQAVNNAFETTLTEGVKAERQLFYACFASEDQKEGMAAFVEKRKPNFKKK